MNHTKLKIIFAVFLLGFFFQGCGYKLGDLEVIGNDSTKTTSISIKSSRSQIQSFINSGFIIDNTNFTHIVIIDGPSFEKQTASVTSNATENEFTIIGTIIVSLYNKEREVIIDQKTISISKDHKFSSSNINSSASEEEFIKSDIRKYLEIQAINIIRGKL